MILIALNEYSQGRPASVFGCTLRSPGYHIEYEHKLFVTIGSQERVKAPEGDTPGFYWNFDRHW